jgi:hypothetical protein
MKIRRLFSLSIIMLATVLVLTLGAGTVSALDFCRTDPILYLSNGKTLLIDVLVDGVRIDQVSWIDYKVTLPKGVTLAPKYIYEQYGGLNNPEFIGDPQLVAKERVKINSTNSKPYEYEVEVNVTANKNIRAGEVTVLAQLGWGKPVLVLGPNGESHWDWKLGSAAGGPAIMQFTLGADGKVGQTIRAKLYAQ